MSRIPDKWDNLFDLDGDLNLITTDLLVEMLKKAADESQSQVSSNCRQYHIWELSNYPKMVSFVFDLCRHLEIDDNFVRYNSCDLYEEFLHQHIINLKQEITSGEFVGEEAALWDNIRRQSLLRLVTCIILSSKISSNYSCKTLDVYCDLIKSFGQNFSKSALMKSEMRVLQTVNYKVDQCRMFTMCPLLILTLIHNEPTLDARLFYSIIYKILDFFYLTKADIFQKLYEKLRESKRIHHHKDFIKVTCDSMLLSCAVIAVVPILLDTDRESKIIQELSYITCYDAKDIEIIRDTIVEKISDVP